MHTWFSIVHTWFLIVHTCFFIFPHVFFNCSHVVFSCSHMRFGCSHLCFSCSHMCFRCSHTRLGRFRLYFSCSHKRFRCSHTRFSTVVLQLQLPYMWVALEFQPCLMRLPLPPTLASPPPNHATAPTLWWVWRNTHTKTSNTKQQLERPRHADHTATTKTTKTSRVEVPYPARIWGPQDLSLGFLLLSLLKGK